MSLSQGRRQEIESVGAKKSGGANSLIFKYLLCFCYTFTDFLKKSVCLGSWLIPDSRVLPVITWHKMVTRNFWRQIMWRKIWLRLHEKRIIENKLFSYTASMANKSWKNPSDCENWKSLSPFIFEIESFIQDMVTRNVLRQIFRAQNLSDFDASIFLILWQIEKKIAFLRW